MSAAARFRVEELFSLSGVAELLPSSPPSPGPLCDDPGGESRDEDVDNARAKKRRLECVVCFMGGVTQRGACLILLYDGRDAFVASCVFGMHACRLG